ncbi:hypothetical protein [Peribacillus acanthi]|uniref:hypothetical protein n=1 Tax=Peribacillus acanthi TaxID=2171554 RepID=UPI00130048F2|nr:hypothetical protein [Peribacillus acanthi]
MKQEDAPVYDRRVNEILKGLDEKIPRDELAKRFGHKNYKTLDIYMRRRNFTWDQALQNYVPKQENDRMGNNERSMPTHKAGMVIELLKQLDFNIEEICQKVGFRDHRELAEYMTAKSYVWSPEERNYVYKLDLEREVQNDKVQEMEEINPKSVPEDSLRLLSNAVSDDILARLERFLPLFEMLDMHKERLLEVITPDSSSDTLPRYIVPGRTSGKTIQMAEPLQDMAVKFCNERNIKQRELFEIALIEFFKRNGYEYEVTKLMRSH